MVANRFGLLVLCFSDWFLILSQWGTHEGFVKYFLRLRSNGKEERAMFFKLSFAAQYPSYTFLRPGTNVAGSPFPCTWFPGILGDVGVFLFQGPDVLWQSHAALVLLVPKRLLVGIESLLESLCSQAGVIPLVFSSNNSGLVDDGSSFREKKFQSSTALSKHIWSLKEKDTNFEIKWEVQKKATEYQNTTGRCNLCVTEKLAIIRADKKTSLNKRSELVSKCRHENRYYLWNFPPPISWSLYPTCLSTNMSLNTISSEPHISYTISIHLYFLSVSHHTSLFFPVFFSLCFISQCFFPLSFSQFFFPVFPTHPHTLSPQSALPHPLPSLFTAILYWTYRAELTNDPSFRVNQKWMTVKPHASVRKRWNTRHCSVCDFVRLAVGPVNSDFDIFIRNLFYLNNKWREDARKLSRPRHGLVNTKTTTSSSEAWSIFFFFLGGGGGASEPKWQWLGLLCGLRLKSIWVRF